MRAAQAAAWLILLAAPAQAEAGVVTVTVTGVRSTAGQVLVAICDRATFLQPTCRYHGRAASAQGAVTIRIDGVPAGTYAVQAFQDENGNGKIDRNFFGMPTEGIGFSNDAKMRFGPPSFDDAAISLGASGGSVALSLHYY